MRTGIRQAVTGFLLAAAAMAASASEPVISIIIDDMGDRKVEGLRAIALPGAVAYAMLPGTPHGAAQARAARAAGKEVLLHFPLQPTSGKAHPMAVTTRSSREELAARLRSELDGLPVVDGVNIHQGSLLSARSDYMHWMMAELRARGGLYFVDSFTSPKSVAWQVADTWQIPSTKRQVFLDDSEREEDIQRQFDRLIAKARKEGSALAIGHPYKTTLSVLERELPKLAAHGVKLVAPSEIIRLRQGARAPLRNKPVLLKLSQSIAPSTRSTGPQPTALH